MWYVVCGIENVAIYYLLLIISLWLKQECSPREIGAALISQGKSAKNEKFELKKAKKKQK